MTNLRQAAQQALEALERGETKLRWAAITALRAALAEPEQEPDGISWLKRDSGYFTAPTPRKPLTDEEIEVAAKSVPAAVYELMYGHEITVEKFRAALAEFARAIERAHGIGEQDEP